MGGSSSINYMHYIRGSRHDFDGWAKEGCQGWSYRDVLPYFIKSENIQIPRLQNSGTVTQKYSDLVSYYWWCYGLFTNFLFFLYIFL